jgi:hypothetical protein
VAVKTLLRSARLLWLAAEVIGQQREQIETLAADRDATELAYQRICRDLMEQFLITLDMPETHDEVRARLVESLGFYRDEIAVREEHV